MNDKLLIPTDYKIGDKTLILILLIGLMIGIGIGIIWCILP